MSDFVKCLGFNELLKQAKTSFEIYCKYKRLDWKLDTRFADEKWVSVDVFKQCQGSLRNRIWELTEAELISHKQAHPTRLITFDEVHAIVGKVFGEAFSQKGSLQEKKERSK